MEYFGLETGAFSQLTRKYMQEEFNKRTPDVESIKSDGHYPGPTPHSR